MKLVHNILSNYGSESVATVPNLAATLLVCISK